MKQRKIEPHEEIQFLIAYVEPVVRVKAVSYLTGYVMHLSGRFVDMYYDEQGPDLEYWDFDNIPPASAKGILVWEGVCANALHYFHGADCEPEFVGKWRNPELTDLQLVMGDMNRRSDAQAYTPDPEKSIDSCTATTGNP